MNIIGLTGPSGSGKSTVAKTAAKMGYFVIDCDAVAREVSNEPEILEELRMTFGNVLKNGVLDRKALAKIAFSSAERTEELNKIMLPAILEKIDLKLKIAEKSGTKDVLLDAPTLFESGADKLCSCVIAVLASSDIRAKRIKKRDSLTQEQLADRMNSSKSDDFYLSRTGYILYNNAEINEYMAAAEKLLKKLKQHVI